MTFSKFYLTPYFMLQVADFSLNREQKIFNIFPKIVMKDKGSYVESSTKEYDQLAFKYLSWILFPLLAGYACYSLLYLEHKGWYSWVLNMLYSFLLTFGKYTSILCNFYESCDMRLTFDRNLYRFYYDDAAAIY